MNSDTDADLREWQEDSLGSWRLGDFYPPQHSKRCDEPADAPIDLHGEIDDIPLILSWFSTAFPTGPAIGDPECTTWKQFCDVFWWRREGEKDGSAFVPARFILETDGRHVRRLGRNVISRAAAALDVETNKGTGEIPPTLDELRPRLEGQGWAALGYTSHSHSLADIRYRLVLPISEEIDPALPAVEVIAVMLGLSGVLDRSKLNPASIFYLPSCADIEQSDQHQVITHQGAAVDAAWVRGVTGALLAERQSDLDRIAAEAHAAAQARLEARGAAGFDPDDSLIEKLRQRLDLRSVLMAHGYDQRGDKYRHPNSSSGSFGADVKSFSGIDRVFSHNGTDPLHRDNLPAWCGGVTALDAVDVAIILDFAGDRPRALHELAKRFIPTKAAEGAALARLIFSLIRRQATQQEIEATATAEGQRLGLSYDEVCRTARWVIGRIMQEAA
jgi:hypothetical protein